MKKILFISRKFDLVGKSAPSRYLLDVIDAVDQEGNQIELLKLDFNTYKKHLFFDNKFRHKLIIPGFAKLNGKLISLSYLFYHKWLRMLKIKIKYRRASGPLSQVETKYIKKLNKKKYDTVIVDYFSLAKALNLFPSKKGIVTHDVWHQHFSVGKSDTFFGNLRASDEAELLQLADFILAISKRDQLSFEKMQLDKTEVIYFPPAIKSKLGLTQGLMKKRFESKNILFVGSNYRPNVFGLEWFIEKVWPLLIFKHDEINLIVIGNVKKYINPEFIDKYDNIQFLGFVDDLQSYYINSKFVISPLLEGTGIKIKNIEAIEYALPIVSTSIGAQGLESFINKGLVVRDDPETFADELLNILTNFECYKGQTELLVSEKKKFMQQSEKKTLQKYLT